MLQNPSDVFASGVTVDQLKARGIDEKHLLYMYLAFHTDVKCMLSLKQQARVQS